MWWNRGITHRSGSLQRFIKVHCYAIMCVKMFESIIGKSFVAVMFWTKGSSAR